MNRLCLFLLRSESRTHGKYGEKYYTMALLNSQLELLMVVFQKHMFKFTKLHEESSKVELTTGVFLRMH